MKCILLNYFWILFSAHALFAQSFDLPQFQRAEADVLPATEDSIFKENEILIKGIENRYKNFPDAISALNAEKFDFIFKGINGLYNFREGMEIHQTAQLKVINNHPEWKSLILECCRMDPFSWPSRDRAIPRSKNFFTGVDLLTHHRDCQWENSKEVYKLLLGHYRFCRQYLTRVDLLENSWKTAKLPEGVEGRDPGNSSSSELLRQILGSVAGVLAKFPTKESIEELCLQLETRPGSWTLAAANALSVCTTEETAPRVHRAFEDAKRHRVEVFPTSAAAMTFPLEFQRLERRLADLNADLTSMPEGAGFRFIKPDWNAAKDTTWNQMPPPITRPSNQSPAVTVEGQNQTSRWPLWLLLLAPGGWLAGWIMGRRRPAA